MMRVRVYLQCKEGEVKEGVFTEKAPDNYIKTKKTA